MGKKLSIVVPVYYNQDSLVELHRQLSAVSSRLSAMQTELIFVDDGSGDHTFEILRQLAAQDSQVRVIRLARNFGTNAAILAGMAYATGDAVACVAADLQDPPHLLYEMVQAWHSGYKAVFTVRRDRDDPLLSRLFSKTFNTLFHWLVLRQAPPTGVGFFLIDRQVADLLRGCEEKNANLINLIVWLGFPAHHILYDRPARQRGQSRWTFSKKLKYAIDTFVAFSYLPIRLASFTGILFALIGMVLVCYVIVARQFLGVEVEGWASLMIVVLVVSGTQMAILGILGEYLWRTLDQTRKRPIFVVDTVIQDGVNQELNC